MTNMTLSIPSELYQKMQKHPEFKWSEVARQAFLERIKHAELADDLSSIAKAKEDHKKGSTLTHSQLLKKLGLEQH